MATRERTPFALGGTFLGLAVLLVVGSILRED
jgi:hypothetical protein